MKMLFQASRNVLVTFSGIIAALLIVACSSASRGVLPQSLQAAPIVTQPADERGFGTGSPGAHPGPASPEYLYAASAFSTNRAGADPVYDMATGKIVKQLYVPAGVTAAAVVSQAGAFYTTLGGNGVTYALGYPSGERRPRLIKQRYNVLGPYVPLGVNAIALDRHGNVYVPTGSDAGPGPGAVVEYDATTLKLIRAYESSDMFASSVAFDRGGNLYGAGCQWTASACAAATFVFRPGQTKPWYVIARSQYAYSLQAAIDRSGDLYVLQAEDPHPSVIEVFHPKQTTPFREIHLPGVVRSFVLDSSDNLYAGGRRQLSWPVDDNYLGRLRT